MREWPFADENNCETLRLNPEYTRRGLSRWQQEAAPVRRHTARIVSVSERRLTLEAADHEEELKQAS